MTEPLPRGAVYVSRSSNVRHFRRNSEPTDMRFGPQSHSDSSYLAPITRHPGRPELLIHVDDCTTFPCAPPMYHTPNARVLVFCTTRSGTPFRSISDVATTVQPGS